MWLRSLTFTTFQTSTWSDEGRRQIARAAGQFEFICGIPRLLSAELRGCTLENRGLSRAIKTLGILTSFAVLLLTMSRGAFVGMAGGIVIGTIYLRHVIRPTQFVRTAVALTALLAVVTVIVAGQYSDLLHARFVEQSSDAELLRVSSGRTEIGQMALSKQIQPPIAQIKGEGNGAFKKT